MLRFPPALEMMLGRGVSSSAILELMKPMRPEHEPSEDGVDVAAPSPLIALRTPSERLDALQGFVDDVVEFRRGRRET